MSEAGGDRATAGEADARADGVETLLRLAGARPRPPAERERAVRDTVAGAWRAGVRRRRRRRLLGFAGAAAALAAVALVWWPAGETAGRARRRRDAGCGSRTPHGFGAHRAGGGRAAIDPSRGAGAARRRRDAEYRR